MKPQYSPLKPNWNCKFPTFLFIRSSQLGEDATRIDYKVLYIIHHRDYTLFTYNPALWGIFQSSARL